MIIRKLFKVEGAHKVLNCSTRRCSYSTHGHSAKIELFFTADGLDNGQMIIDFGLLKAEIKDFIDSFDHSYSMWNKMSQDEREFHKKYSERWIEMPVSPSAESYALMFLFIIDCIINATEFKNGEQNPIISSVRYHETDTGYAEAFRDDLKWVKYTPQDIKFSEGIQREWSNKWWYESLCLWFNLNKKSPIFFNPKIDLQVDVSKK